MKHSIRVRFTMIFVGLMAAVLFTTWAVNSFFLEGFYTRQKVKILERAYELLNTMVVERSGEGGSLSDDLQSLYSSDGEQTELSRMLRLMSEKYNITIAIVDSMNDNMVPSYRDGRFLADRVHQYILGKNEPQTETLISEDNYKIQRSYDRRSQGYYLESWGFFDDNRTIFIMSMPCLLYTSWGARKSWHMTSIAWDCPRRKSGPTWKRACPMSSARTTPPREPPPLTMRFTAISRWTTLSWTTWC